MALPSLGADAALQLEREGIRIPPDPDSDYRANASDHIPDARPRSKAEGEEEEGDEATTQHKYSDQSQDTALQDAQTNPQPQRRVESGPFNNNNNNNNNRHTEAAEMAGKERGNYELVVEDFQDRDGQHLTSLKRADTELISSRKSGPRWEQHK